MLDQRDELTFKCRGDHLRSCPARIISHLDSGGIVLMISGETKGVSNMAPLILQSQSALQYVFIKKLLLLLALLNGEWQSHSILLYFFKHGVCLCVADNDVSNASFK